MKGGGQGGGAGRGEWGSVFAASKILMHSSVVVAQTHYASLINVPTADPTAMVVKFT